MKGQKKFKINFKLLMVNKQICQEASSILYDQELRFGSLDSLQHFMCQIGKCNIESLKNIIVENLTPRCYRSKNLAHPTCALLMHAISLESFRIDYLWDPDRETRLQTIALNVSVLCYVWIEQMAHYRNDAKSWQDVFDLK